MSFEAPEITCERIEGDPARCVEVVTKQRHLHPNAATMKYPAFPCLLTTGLRNVLPTGVQQAAKVFQNVVQLPIAQIGPNLGSCPKEFLTNYCDVDLLDYQSIRAHVKACFRQIYK